MPSENTLTFELDDSLGESGVAARSGAIAIAAGELASDDSVETARPAAANKSTSRGNIFRKGILSLFDQAVVSATSFLTMLLLGRASGIDSAVERAHQLGLYQLGLTIVLLAICVQNSLISTPYAVFSNRMDRSLRPAFAGSTLLHQWFFSVFVAIVLSIAGTTLALGIGPAEAAPILWLLVPLIPFILLREFVRRLTFTHLQVLPALLLDVSIAALQLGGLLALRLTGNLKAVTAFSVIGGACALAAGFALFKLRDEFNLRQSKPMADLRGNWSFGKWAFGGQVVFLLMIYSVSWMLAIIESPDATGRYAACMSLVMAANPLWIGLDNFLSPQTLHVCRTEGPDAMLRLTLRAALLITTLMIPLMLLLFLSGGPLMALLYKNTLPGNQAIVSVGALSILLHGFSSSSENALVALHRPAEIFWANLTGLVVTVVAGCVLIPSHGVLGGTIAGVIGLFVTTVWKGRVFVFSHEGKVAAHYQVET
jgi:O-antigen/teichoic acid export membrane protein